ncbi:biopolymer transporter Tol [Opitutaceae bacterium TAV4]|uniref:PD40 domain-containing protein n=1 Tax=Geminisphaera colitermitum TaxID=1148786 RepID=UPI000158CE45|nr:PD40 domain-containing protein [Geminisphaera colitermitum]RRJ95357.1 biopolymer transporter Tol [Opitutaceae bacterium TAV4]RRK02539.1 biopolymer transporter Tol [Opitutaceae bacterium TAV3]
MNPFCFHSRSRNLFSLITVFAVSLAGVVFTAGARAQQRDLGDITVTGDGKTIPVRVSATSADLDNLAKVAFDSHGRYRRVASGGFDVRFTAVGGNQVQVSVTRGAEATPVVSQVVAGTSARSALLAAADVAVKATSGLNGYFNTRLAFISERSGKPEVYTSDLFAGEIRQITHDNALAVSPRWSPDGQGIIYTSYFRRGFPDIFKMDLNTLQRSTLVSFKGTNTGARYSPNGAQIAMVLSGEGNPELYISDSQGRGVRRLTRTASVEASPCFSPDGSQLVFTSDAAGGPQLYVMSTAGGGASRLPTNLSRYCAEPDWSRANPNKIAFTVRIGSGFQIAVYDMSTRSAAVVSKAPNDAVEPSWLADGRHLIYTQRSANKRSLHILDTETGRSMLVSAGQLGQCSQASVWPN